MTFYIAFVKKKVKPKYRWNFVKGAKDTQCKKVTEEVNKETEDNKKTISEYGRENIHKGGPILQGKH